MKKGGGGKRIILKIKAWVKKFDKKTKGKEVLGKRLKQTKENEGIDNVMKEERGQLCRAFKTRTGK